MSLEPRFPDVVFCLLFGSPLMLGIRSFDTCCIHALPLGYGTLSSRLDFHVALLPKTCPSLVVECNR